MHETLDDAWWRDLLGHLLPELQRALFGPPSPDQQPVKADA
jgi:hypothetical protein